MVPVTGRHVKLTGSLRDGRVTVITGSPWRKLSSAIVARRIERLKHGRTSKLLILPEYKIVRYKIIVNINIVLCPSNKYKFLAILIFPFRGIN